MKKSNIFNYASNNKWKTMPNGLLVITIDPLNEH